MNRRPLDRLFQRAVGGTEKFRSNFLRLATANVLAQAAAVAALPALTRLFAPQDFALLAVYTTVQSMLLAIVTARFEWLVPNQSRPSGAARLIGAGGAVTATATLIVAGALFASGGRIGEGLGIAGPSRTVLWLLPIALCAGGLQLLLESWHVFRGDLGAVSYAKVAQAVTTLVVSVAAGLASAGAIGLVGGYVVGFVAAVLMLARGQGDLLRLLCAFKPAALIDAIRMHWRDVSASVMLSIVNVAMTSSILILVTLHYGATTVGWYGLVFRVAAAPLSLVTTAIAHSFWSDAAGLAKADPLALRRFYLQSVQRLAILAAPCALVFLAAPFYIGPIFGEAQWSGAGALLAAATPYLIGILIFSPTTHLIVYGRQGWQLACDFAALCAAALLFSFFASQGFEAWVAIFAGSLALLGGYVCRFLLHLRANDVLASTFRSDR